MKNLEFTTSQNVPMLVRIVLPGQYYGRDNVVLNDSKEHLVEFFDTRYPFFKNTDGEILGQFISRYYLTTLLESKNEGICLDGGNRIWDVDTNSFNKVIDYLVQFQNTLTKNSKPKIK
jgi:hypothetical protein